MYEKIFFSIFLFVTVMTKDPGHARNFCNFNLNFRTIVRFPIVKIIIYVLCNQLMNGFKLKEFYLKNGQ